jgi:hypothetical protein
LLRKLLVLIFCLFLLTACRSAGQVTSATANPTTTKIPVASPTPSMPLVILILPADMPKADSDQYQTLVYNLAQTNHMRFQVRNALSAADVAFEGPALKIVIALPPNPGLVELATSAPHVQFLAVSIPDLAPAANLSTLGASGVLADQQGFLAGYIAGMVAPEWRTGILSQKDTPGGEAARTGFENGYHFYCGDCFNPNFNQPFSHGKYPVVVRIPTDVPQSAYDGHADLLIQNFVKVAFVYPAVATPELLSYMAQSNLNLIGQALPSEDIRSNWIASIQPDLFSALQGIFPELLAGHGGQNVPTPLHLADVNPNLLSDAKLRLVQQVLDGLQNGTIGTGVTP